jgi:hypothetical protein
MLLKCDMLFDKDCSGDRTLKKLGRQWGVATQRRDQKESRIRWLEMGLYRGPTPGFGRLVNSCIKEGSKRV